MSWSAENTWPTAKDAPNQDKLIAATKASEIASQAAEAQAAAFIESDGGARLPSMRHSTLEDIPAGDEVDLADLTLI